MKKISLALILCLAGALSACNQNTKPSETATANTTQPSSATGSQMVALPTSNATPDSMTDELKKLAGAGATDCGRVGTTGDVQSASECAMKANDAKKAFYVRYDLPMPDAQMAIATVRTADGKLMSVQYDSKGWEKPVEGAKLSDDKKVATGPCPEPGTLRIANSGRVTCFPPTKMPAGMSPHGGGMKMPPSTGEPHGGIGTPAPGTPNPHMSGAAPTKAH